MYIARKRLKIDGVYRQIGEAVPEALTWRTVESYVRSGHLDWVEDKPKAAKKAIPTPAKVEEPVVEPAKIETPALEEKVVVVAVEEPKVEEESVKPSAK